MADTLMKQLEDAIKAKADGDAELAKAKSALADESSKLATALTERDAALATAKTSGEQAEKASAALAGEQAAHEATKGELRKAQAALANPAHMDAALVGCKVPVPEGGGHAATAKTKEEALAEYSKISDPHERAQYRKDNAEILGLK